jgi:glycerate-2-kinase
LLIKNYDNLIHDELDKDQIYLRKIALECLRKAIKAVKPQELIKKSLKIDDWKLKIQEDSYDLNNFDKIFIIGGGKATYDMAVALEEKLKNSGVNLPYYGCISIPDKQKLVKDRLSSNIKVIKASHPIPNENGVKGVKKIFNLIRNASKNDLIIILISGGGSALLPFPRKNISLPDLEKLNSLLLKSGASIHEINTIRKHLSKFKGGNLARYVNNSSGATLISLIISDVVGNNLDSIASGPTVPDPTTFRDAWKILDKYGLIKKVPTSVKTLINEGMNDSTLETPKSEDPCFDNVHNYLIGSVEDGVDQIQNLLKVEDFSVKYFSNQVTGEARDYSGVFFNILEEKINECRSKRLALIGSGELTVTIRGNGIGGRNQELLLSFLKILKDKKLDYKFLVLAANLDGIEGNSKAMGALIDNVILDTVRVQNIDLSSYLEENDSNSFFKSQECEIISGPTGCNVNDIIICLIKRNKG